MSVRLASFVSLVLLLAACATPASRPGALTPLNLSHNDNILGPSPAIAPEFARDGGADPSALPAALATRWKVPSEWLLLGNGSEDILARLMKATTSDGHSVLTHAHAYIAFRKLTEELHASYREAPLTPDFRIDVDALLRAVDATTALVVLASPVNPSGTYLRADEAEHLASELETRGVLLVLDSAYLEYVRAPDFADPFALLRRHANVVVLGTFSKVYGLAKPKVGYLAARPEVLQRIRSVASPEVPPEALRAALAALGDEEHVERSRQATWKSLDELAARLPALGLMLIPSQGNFVMAHSPIASTTLTARIEQQGVLILDLSSYALPDYVRITAGTPEQNARLIAALKASLKP